MDGCDWNNIVGHEMCNPDGVSLSCQLFQQAKKKALFARVLGQLQTLVSICLQPLGYACL